MKSVKSVKSGGFHPEIRRISWNPWNPADFTCEIWWISPVKSGGFHPEIQWISPRYHLWNPPKIIKASVSAKALQFDECRVGTMTKDFTCEIQQSSPWNLADLTCEIQWISPRYHLWNPPKIIKASVSAKTLQFDECRVGDFTLKSGGFHPWHLADFTQISPVKSTQNYKSKCFSKNSSVWWMQGWGLWPRISPVKSSRVHPDFIYEIHPKL